VSKTSRSSPDTSNASGFIIALRLVEDDTAALQFRSARAIHFCNIR
jgi:hypothetical protein